MQGNIFSEERKEAEEWGVRTFIDNLKFSERLVVGEALVVAPRQM